VAAFLRDARVRAIGAQAALIRSLVLLVWWLADNTARNLAARGIAIGFGFMAGAARFPISESLIAYTPTDSFARAYVIGLLNTLFVSTLVILGATVLGFVVALGRRSINPLVNGVATVFVEAMRNTPLVVQLLFWYALLTTTLPAARNALSPMPGVFLSVRGLFFPSVTVAGDVTPLLVASTSWLVATAAILLVSRRRRRLTGLGLPHAAISIAALGVTAIAYVIWQGSGLAMMTPELRGFSFVGGTRLTPEFASLLIGLVLYSSAFVGEVIRGGVDAVGKGQWEAGRSVGLPDGRILRLVIVPQALRIIIPPMTSQYFNIVKNTTLALAVGYPDISFVVATTINQTGQAIEGIAILLAVFLSISLAISLFMNWYNSRVALVQR
jgi:general L-amino acid transport system permease protein